MQSRQFSTDEPIGYLITWTTYGTWLPGDGRGSWHKNHGEVPASALLRQSAAAEMKEPAFLLDTRQRQIVEQTISRHCEVRRWVLHAVNARSNHVHVVVTAHGYKPETVRDQFKAWSTRHLQPLNRQRERFWTEGASCRWINGPLDLDAAITYVNDAQDHKGLDS